MLRRKECHPEDPEGTGQLRESTSLENGRQPTVFLQLSSTGSPKAHD